MPNIQELYRVGVRVYFKDLPGLDLAAAVPVFHRWIQNSSVPGLLIDVADYRHVEHGPGVLLIAHEGNYGFSVSGAQPGLEYYQKRPGGLDIASRWQIACRNALQGARLLCEEADIGTRLEVDSSHLRLFSRDRLLAPNTRSTGDALRPAVEGVLGKLYADSPYSLEPQQRHTDLFAVEVSGGPSVDTAVLIASVAQ